MKSVSAFPVQTLMRVGASLVLRRIPGLKRRVRVDSQGFRVVADLTTAQGLQIYRYGLDDADAHLVAKLLRPGDTFVDGGANVGVFTLICARAVGPEGKVIALEPARATFNRLLAHVSSNHLYWVNCLPAAFGEHAGIAEFYAFDGDGAGTSSLTPDRDGGERQLVPVITLDQLSLTPGGRLRLVKLDLEGAELHALRGAREILRTCPHLFIEVEDVHLRRMEGSAYELLQLLRAAGYQLFCRVPGTDNKICRFEISAAETPNVLATKDVEWVSDSGIEVC